LVILIFGLGVRSVKIDVEEGLVYVEGKVDLAKLIEAIRNTVKRKAEVLQYEKGSGPHSAREDDPVKNIGKTNVLSGEKHEYDSGKVNPNKPVYPVKKVGKTNSLSGREKHEDDSGKVNPNKPVDPVKNIGKAEILSSEKHEDDSGKVNPVKLEDLVKKIGKKTHEDNHSGKKNPMKFREPVKNIGKTKAESAEKVPNIHHQFKRTYSTHCHDSDSSLDDDDGDDDVVHSDSSEFSHHHHHHIHKMKPMQHDHGHRHDVPHRHHHDHHHPQHYNVPANGENVNGGRLFCNPPAAPAPPPATGGYCPYVPAGPPRARPRHGYEDYHHQPPAAAASELL
jgi:hypothetical protein